jgi:hypothetical protein
MSHNPRHGRDRWTGPEHRRVLPGSNGAVPLLGVQCVICAAAVWSAFGRLTSGHREGR